MHFQRLTIFIRREIFYLFYFAYVIDLLVI